MRGPLVSVVVPALNEGATLGALLGDLGHLEVPHEVIVADGGSTDDTVTVCRAHGAEVAVSRRGRGTQLRAGAAMAEAPLLCFIHADARLDGAARREIERLASHAEEGAWAFRLRIASTRRAYRLVERGVNLRSRLLSLPYGDQGLVISRGWYDAVGGFADVPIMEDVMIARALRAVGGISLLPASVTVSARRWEREGVLRRSVRNLWLLGRFLAGSTPGALAAGYASHDAQSARPSLRLARSDAKDSSGGTARQPPSDRRADS